MEDGAKVMHHLMGLFKISVASIFPVFGLIATCPDMNSILPACTAWLYGPMGSGASRVMMILFSIRKNTQSVKPKA